MQELRKDNWLIYCNAKNPLEIEPLHYKKKKNQKPKTKKKNKNKNYVHWKPVMAASIWTWAHYCSVSLR